MSTQRTDGPLPGCHVSMNERTDAERSDDPTLDALTRLDRESMLAALYRKWGVDDPAAAAREDAAGGDASTVAGDVDARLARARAELADYDARRRDEPEPAPAVDSEQAKFNAMVERNRNQWRHDSADEPEPAADDAERQRRDCIETVERLLPEICAIRPSWREMDLTYLKTLAAEAIKHASTEGSA